MNESKFNGKAGRLILDKEEINGQMVEYYYFYPNPLPEQLMLEPHIIKKLNDACLNLGELRGLIKNIGKVLNLFISVYRRKEAVLSTKIEGTRVSLTDIFLDEAGSKELRNIQDIREVRNYIESLNFALDRISKGEKVNKDLLNNMHYVLLKDARGSERSSGEYRKRQNWIGRSSDIKLAEFVPPHAKHVPSLMDNFFRYMEQEDDIPGLIKIGLMHYFFETVHPYEDGNGRLGRTLILLYLNQLKIIEEPILYLSVYFEKYREEYYNLLMKIRWDGDYIGWIDFFLDAITEVSKDTSQRVKKLIELYEEFKEKLKKIHATPTSFALLDKFFENPYASIPNLQSTLKGNYPLIKRGIEYLQKADIIIEITHRKRRKFYVASKILDIIEKD